MSGSKMDCFAVAQCGCNAGGIPASHFFSASPASFWSFSPSSNSFRGPGIFRSSNHLSSASASGSVASLFQRL